MDCMVCGSTACGCGLHRKFMPDSWNVKSEGCAIDTCLLSHPMGFCLVFHVKNCHVRWRIVAWWSLAANAMLCGDFRGSHAVQVAAVQRAMKSASAFMQALYSAHLVAGHTPLNLNLVLAFAHGDQNSPTICNHFVISIYLVVSVQLRYSANM
eukprot:141959-Amphidinium_carterae.1